VIGQSISRADRETEVLDDIRSLLQDIRYGARLLYRNLGFTCVAVLSLALVIGASSSVFSVLNAVLLKPFPCKNPDRVVEITEVRVDQSARWRNTTIANFLEWSKQSQSFEEMSMANSWADLVTISTRGYAERGGNQLVSASLFSLLGVEPQLGRSFVLEDVPFGVSEAAIISDRFWRRRFGADPSVLGERMTIQGKGATIIGVMPPGFWIFPWNRNTDVWRAFNLSSNTLTPRTRWFCAIGLLKPDVSPKQAGAELDTIFQHLVEEDSAGDTGWQVRVRTIQDALFSNWKDFFYLLFGIVGLVLLIGCANVANMLLAKGRRREKEIAVRISLGAGRTRLVQQLLTECVLLALLGGLLGVFLTIWGIQVIVALTPQNWPIPFEEIHIDGRVLAFTALISLLTAVIFGLAPALQASNPNLTGALKEGGRHPMGERRPRIRNLLAVSEITMALVLLVCAGLMVNSFLRLQNVDPGYDPHNLLRSEIRLQGPKYWAQIGGDMKRVTPQVDLFFQELLERTEALAGVESAAVAGTWSCSFRIVGARSTEEEPPWATHQVVSADYFSTLGVPLLRGRTITEQDVEGTSWVAVINEAFARQYFPDEEPLGKLLNLSFGGYHAGRVEEEQPREIVGVVRDFRPWGLGWEPQPTVYVSEHQHIWEYPEGSSQCLLRKTLLVRTTANVSSFIPLIARIVADIDGDQAPYDTMTMEQALSESINYWRFWMRLFGLFAAVAVLLVVVGIYGVMSYSVSERTHEMGVRIAIGAQRTDVLSLVLKQGLKLTLIGVAIGVAVALGVTRLISSYLYGVSSTDPLTFGAISMLVVAVAIAACYLPARWATKVDPLIALRHE
jgi:putative ABC transport system permease protein